MIDVFVLKKLVSLFVHFTTGALLTILFLLLLKRWIPRVSNVLVVFLVCLLILGATPGVSNSIVGSLESRFAPLQMLPEDAGLILVLGYGHMYQPERSANSVLMAGALSRVTEAVRLWKTRPQVSLALSGARFRSPISHASAMQAEAVRQGVFKSDTVLFDSTRDTEEEIDAALSYMQNNGLTDSRLVVVSSATHLPRAQLMLGQHDIAYTLVPTDFLVLDAPWYRADAYYLRSLDRAVHEYVGMLWYRIKS